MALVRIARRFVVIAGRFVGLGSIGRVRSSTRRGACADWAARLCGVTGEQAIVSAIERMLNDIRPITAGLW
jgi:hypothetical protein